MRAPARFLGSLVFCVASGYCGDVCPKAVVEESGTAPNLSWTSGVHRLSAERLCTRQQVTSLNMAQPMPVLWPAAGILDAKVSGQFVTSFCCSEEVEVQKAVLRYAEGNRQSVDTLVHAGLPRDDDDYPDLMEPDAKIKQSSYTGSLWDGSKYVRVDLELRASASHPHFAQSVFEFKITDQSPEPLQVDWDVLREMNRTMKAFFTDNPGSGLRQSTYVFFAKERPAAQTGVVTLRTAAGKLLGRFVAEGFTNESPGKR